MYVYFGRPRDWWISPFAILKIFRGLLRYPQPDAFHTEAWFRSENGTFGCDRGVNGFSRLEIDGSPLRIRSALIHGICILQRPFSVILWSLSSKNFGKRRFLFRPLIQTIYPNIFLHEPDHHHPTLEQWRCILDEIIWSLKQDDASFLDHPREDREALLKRMINGHRLFGKYYRHLWW
jgi:hypothetical protein